MPYLVDVAEAEQMTRRDFIKMKLDKHGHNLSAVSRDIGLSRQGLHKWLKDNGFYRDRKQMKWVEVGEAGQEKPDDASVGSRSIAGRTYKRTASPDESERSRVHVQS